VNEDLDESNGGEQRFTFCERGKDGRKEEEKNRRITVFGGSSVKARAGVKQITKMGGCTTVREGTGRGGEGGNS